MRKRIVAVGVLLVLLASTQVLAQNGNDLFQQALSRQTANGDIQGAIRIYERIVRDFASNRPLVAKTLVQLGKSYESLGQVKSREYYDQVVSKYGDQADMVAEARARLAASAKAATPLQVATPPTEDASGFAISPDGHSLMFAVVAAGRGQLWLRDLVTNKTTPISGADLVRPPQFSGGVAPFWSADSKSIAYFSDQKLKRIDAVGGIPQTLADAPTPYGGAWNRDGTIVFASLSPSGGLFRVPADGSRPAVPIAMEGVGNSCPRFLPDGHRFLFYRVSEAAARGQVAQVLWVGSLDSPEVKVLPVQAYAGTFAEPAQLLYATQQGFFAQRLDMETLQLTGPPVRLSEQVAVSPPNCVFAVSSAPSGMLAYRAFNASSERQLVWLDRGGKQTGSFVPDPASPCCARIAPNGRTIVFGRNGGGAPAGSLWVIEDSPRAEARRLIAGTKFGVWSPIGDRLALALLRPTPPFGPSIALIRSEGPLAASYLRLDVGERPSDWSKDRTYSSAGDLLALPVQGDVSLTAGEPIPVAQTTANETRGRFSPDGKWIVYQSTEPGGHDEVFVQPFPGSPDSRKRVSLNGGTSPTWRGDGRELYYLSPDFHLMVVTVTLPEKVQEIGLGTPAPLFPAALPAGSEYDPSPDGQRFLVNRPTGPVDNAPITVLSNWTRAK